MEPRVDRRREKLFPISRHPTATEAAGSRWFSPIHAGRFSLETRTWIPAMVPWRATDEGFVTPAVLEWYARFAKGRPGAIVVEATGVRDVKSGPLLRASDDRFIDGLKSLVAAVKQASGGHTRLFIQLIDFLAIKRRPAKEAFITRFLQEGDVIRTSLPEPLRAQTLSEWKPYLLALDDEGLRAALSPRAFEAYRMGVRERVTDTQVPHIRDLPKTLPGIFAAAARRCEVAGFDGVELHYAHAYTMASFLSRLNTRTDGYGGSREHRARLPLEVFRAVRGAVNNRFVVGTRFLAHEIIDGGSTEEDAAFFGVEFARAGMDFLSLSRGGKFEDARQPKVGAAAYPYTGPSGHECMPTTKMEAPFGRNLPAVATVRRAVMSAGFKTPIVACGGISSFEQAEAALADGTADVIASARQSLADPDWFEKLRTGRGAEIRRCLFTNYCEGLDQAHDVVTCQTWDRLKGLEDDATCSRLPDGRRAVAPG